MRRHISIVCQECFRFGRVFLQKFERNAIGQPAGVERPGNPKEFLEEYVKQTGDRYKMPD